jgi:hypothetical protein
MVRNALLGFIAGVIATLVFHQGTIWLLQFGPGFPFPAWRMSDNAYGVPAVLALSFWAGIWGVPLAWLLAARPAWPQLLTGAVLGSVVPSVWGWTVIATMRGGAMFAGGNLRIIALVLFVNAVWGWATVLLWQQMRARMASLTGPLEASRSGQ